jgi:2-succinyl-6-hydroxy-2,4-cyclohexadiene-1-carboxylate synthase
MRVVFVPGFTQTAAIWDPVIGLLPEGADVVAHDVPAGLGFVETAHALHGGRATYVGYSMGGRLCLRLALDRPDVVERLVLVSSSAGIAERGRRAHRRLLDETWARMVEREGVDAFYERWFAQPLFRGLAREARGIDARVRDPRVLTHQLRALGQGAMEPLWDRLGELRAPVTLAVGALDTAYVRIGQQMRHRISHGRIEIIEGAGHATHLERPEAVAALLDA